VRVLIGGFGRGVMGIWEGFTYIWREPIHTFDSKEGYEDAELREQKFR
jgi:hypothetical protein